jgi:hypothetical protein
MDRITNIVLVACCFVGLAIALIAPDAFAQHDAGGAPEPAVAVVADAGAVAAPEPPVAAVAPETGEEAAVVALDGGKAALRGDLWAALSAFVLLCVWGLRELFQDWARFRRWVLDSEAGGPAFTFVVAFLLALASPLAAGPPDLDTLKIAGGTGLLAIGGWHSVVKRFLLPLGRWAVKRFRE